MKTHTKTRFCPSPTGYVHLGNVRTAFFNALLAKHDDGVFLIRIEDTDKERSKSEYVTALMEDLRWLSMDWQEGPEAEADNGPYYQSERGDIYATYYQQLVDMKRAYPCFCSEDQLALSRKLQRASGKPPRYAGTCRGLSEAEAAEKISQGLKPTLRFRLPDNELIEFDDVVKGKQKFDSNDIGDFIIRRADGTASFMFCNAIDDSLMGVTHALRGEDHLTNTPRQVAILRALDMREPTYGHTSLILGQDGAPLSKRNGSRSVRELREMGYLPGAVLNYLARLGHYYKDNNYFSYSELAEQFKSDNLSSSPARYDEAQLNHWQKEALAVAGEAELNAWLGDVDGVPADKHAEFVNVVKANIMFPADAKPYAEQFFASSLVLSEEAQGVIDNAHVEFYQTALALAETHGCDFSLISNGLKEQLSVKSKALFQPLRVALTGQLHGPELGPIMALMGDDRVKARFKALIA